MRKSWQVFHDRSLLLRSFWSFILLVLEYCSAADSYLKLLDRVVVVPQRVCPSKTAPLRKSKHLAGECHRSSGLLMLCCVLMCMSAGSGSLCVLGYGCQCYSVCRLHQRNHLFSIGKLAEQCDVCNKACWGVLSQHVVVRVLSGVCRGEEYLILCWDQVFV